jgi:UDP-N-acetylmuramyl pentapeptide phosphotransferase/UDP-N-acetylglucosamine-1-phosphate transferase
MQALGLVAIAAAVAALVARGTAPLARARGWTDPRPGAPALERKREQAPVPFTGAWSLGLAGWVGLGAALGLGWSPSQAGWCAGDVPPLLAAGLLSGAAALGLADDLRPCGLSPRVQLLTQALLCAPLAWLWGPWFLPFGLAAFAAVNTADHSDGWCASFTAAAGWPGAPLLGGASLGFLSANLDRGLRGERGPTAFLGDGGSNLLAMWLLLLPPLWPLLVVPGADLARVLGARALHGQAPWQGDRRHLGQRLQAAGWPLTARLFAWVAAVALASSGPRWASWEVGSSSLELGAGALAATVAIAVLGARPPRWPRFRRP